MPCFVGTRRWLSAAAASAIVASAAGDAHATGAVVSSPPGAAQVADVHVAIASAAGRTTRWARLRVHGTATAFAWIVPARPGAMLDLASDAWFESLDAASGPRVLPPATAMTCSAARAPELVDSTAHVASHAPSDLAIAKDETQLEASLAAWGFMVPSDLRAQLATSFASGDVAVALFFAASSSDTTTASLRIVDGAKPELPLAWTVAQTSDVAVTAYVVGTGRADLGMAPTLAIDPAEVLWNQDGTSTYRTARAQLVLQRPSSWLLEHASGASLFDLRSIPGGAIPPLVDGYFARASAYGDGLSPYDACVTRADGERFSPLALSLACPRGALARVDAGDGPVTCAESTSAQQIAPDAFRCGTSADDLALALSGQSPSTAWLTRAWGIVPAGVYGSNVLVQASLGAEQPATVTASGYAFTCGGSTGGGAGGGGGGTGGGGGGGGVYGSPDPGGVNAGAQVGYDVPPPDDTGTDVPVDGSSCDCGGDTSGTSDGSSSDSCSSSSSSESSSGDSCGSSGSSGDSGGCSGGSGGSGDCSTAKHKGKSPMSRYAIAIAFALALIRRRTRATIGR